MQNTLRVNEIFTSIQGEGEHTGRLATFIRLQGCNLNCEWCDTKNALSFNQGIVMLVDDILKKIPSQFRFIVITGGEPFFQKNVSGLITMLKAEGYYIQVETNGTLFNAICDDIDWLTVSPKPPTYMIHTSFYPFVKEVKLIVDKNLTEDVVKFYVSLKFNIPVTLQPESNKEEFVGEAMSFMKSVNTSNLKLRLQQHKLMGVR